jgi:hypothetical protein
MLEHLSDAEFRKAFPRRAWACPDGHASDLDRAGEMGRCTRRVCGDGTKPDGVVCGKPLSGLYGRDALATAVSIAIARWRRRP